jgi:hypothetical protein
VIFQYGLLGCQNSRIVIFIRRVPFSIQVDAVGIKTPLASSHSVCVKHRDDFEYIIVKEDSSLNVFEVGELVNNTLQHILSWCLTAVNSTG